jgi:hypothetical protein
MADMRSIGTAVEEYAIDNNFYPVQTTQGDLNQGSPTIGQILENNAAYIKLTPRKDGWNKEIQYGTPTCGHELHAPLVRQGHGRDRHASGRVQRFQLATSCSSRVSSSRSRRVSRPRFESPSRCTIRRRGTSRARSLFS